MIGAFYQPEAVIIDTSTLRTLPEREYVSGIAEVIKYGAIRGICPTATQTRSRMPCTKAAASSRDCRR